MGETPIEWVIGPDGSRGHSINPIRFRNLETGKVGHFCEKISAECKNCYSSTMQKPYLSGLEFVAENRDKGELYLDDAVLESVLRRRKPTGYFWCDMTDMFGDWVPDEWIDKCFAVMALTPQHRHYVLTKRADRMRAHMTTEFMCNRVLDQMIQLTPNRGVWAWGGMAEMFEHIWLGVSVGYRKALARIDHLRATPAAVRFLSVEPLLEDLGTIDLSDIGWVIVGGESGPGARPCRLEWIRSIVQQCAAAGVPCFVKQIGSRPEFASDHWPEGLTSALWSSDLGFYDYPATKKGGDPTEWPDDLRVRQFPEARNA